MRKNHFCIHKNISQKPLPFTSYRSCTPANNIFNAQNKHTKYWISFCFKALVIGFDFCKRCHHYLEHFSKTPRYRVSGKRHTHLCYKIYQAHSRPISTGGKGFSDQSDHRCLNGRRFIFVNVLKMGTWSVSPKRSGFRRFVGITYSATFR